MAGNQSRLLVFLVAVAVVFQSFPAVRGYASQQPRGVELSKVTAITLFKGQYTAGRRSKGVAQLVCTGGCHLYSPVTVQCENVGSDGRDTQWRCEADMPSSVGFESTQVSCEGYNYPDDPLVLEGSCGLEFSLRRVRVRGGGKGFGFWNPFRGMQQAGARYSDEGHGGFQESAIKRGSAGWDAWQLLIGLFVTFIIWKAFRIFSGGASRYPPPSSSDTSGGAYPSAPPPPTGSGWFGTGSGYGTGTGGRGWGSTFRGGGGGWGSTFGRGGGGGSGFGGNRMGHGAGWGSNGWASHAGSAGLGYWLGSRGRAAARPTFPSGARFQPGSNANSTWSSGSSSRAETTEKSTGYATTKRR